MKQFHILLLTLLLACSLQAQNAHLTVSRCDQIMLPGAVEGISFCDNRLYLRIPQLMLSSSMLGGHLQPPEGDAEAMQVDDVMAFLRHPVTGRRYYVTTAGKMYQQVPRDDKSPKSERLSLPHFSGHILTPTFSSDGRWLLFASDARGGVGGTDLYAAFCDSLGRWQQPLLLDTLVNTPGNEWAPVLVDGTMIYSSADKADSVRVLSCCSIRLLEPDDEHPQGRVVCGQVSLLPPPFNEGMGNCSLVLNADASRGYWLSNRDGQVCLYQFVGSLQSAMVWGRVYNGDYQPLAGVRVTLRRNGNTVETVNTDADGNYRLFLEKDQPYDLFFSLRDYFTEQVPLRVDCQTDGQLICDWRNDMVLSRLQYDTTMYLLDLFGTDAEEELSAEGRGQLEQLVRFMRENPHVVAAVSLRTDLTTDASYNHILNAHRLESLKKYVASQVAVPNVVYYNDCDYDGGCSSGTVNSILAIVLRDPAQYKNR